MRRSLFALATICGAVSAGNIYNYQGSSHFTLGQFVPPSDLPAVRPPGNYTNSTVWKEAVEVKEEPLIKIKVDHGVDIGYSGEYKSQEVNNNELWEFNYDLSTYGKVVETINILVADFYNLKIQLSFKFLDMKLLSQNFKFVHPLAILAAKAENPPVNLKFDVKSTTYFLINELLEVNILVGDDMRANFNQKLDNLFKEAFKFAVTESTGGNYADPADDTMNIANAENYYPGTGDFVPGGQVFTNPFATGTTGRRIPITKWDFTPIINLIRSIKGNKDWQYDPKHIGMFWLFGTRNNLSDIPI